MRQNKGYHDDDLPLIIVFSFSFSPMAYTNTALRLKKRSYSRVGDTRTTPGRIMASSPDPKYLTLPKSSMDDESLAIFTWSSEPGDNHWTPSHHPFIARRRNKIRPLSRFDMRHNTLADDGPTARRPTTATAADQEAAQRNYLERQQTDSERALEDVFST